MRKDSRSLDTPCPTMPRKAGSNLRTSSWLALPPSAVAMVAVVALLGALGPPIASGQEGSEPDEVTEAEGAPFLLLPVGAQGIGSGRAMTAMASEEAAFWNPAGLAAQQERRLSIYRGEQIDPSIALNVLWPLSRLGTVGFSYYLLDQGEQTLTDDFNNVLGELSIRSHLAIASFGTALPWGIHAGVNAKLVQRREGCRGDCQERETTSSAYAWDVGVQAQPLPGVPLRVGWMLAHLGTRFRSRDAKEAQPLPARMRVGVAYEALGRLVEDGMMNLWLSVEAEDRVRALGSPSVHVGMNLHAADLVSIAIGYAHLHNGDAQERQDLGRASGATVGVGFSVDPFDLGLSKYLARSTLTELSEPVHVSLGVSF